jgi:hypothetical protein
MTQESDVGSGFHVGLQPGPSHISEIELYVHPLHPPGWILRHLPLNVAHEVGALIDPGLTANRLRLSVFRRQAQQVAGITVERGFSQIAE